MCNTCRHTPCIPTCPTIQYVACPQFPSAPGATGPQGPGGLQGPPGPQGPPGASATLVIVNIENIDSPYNVVGNEDAILVDTTNGAVIINLLAANDPLILKRVSIKDALGTTAVNSITINPSGIDTIDFVAAPRVISTAFESLEFTSNLTNGYNLT